METATTQNPAKQVGEISSTWMERMGLTRTTGAILLILLGVLVVVFPAFLRWAVGLAAIGLGILALTQGKPAGTTDAPTVP